MTAPDYSLFTKPPVVGPRYEGHREWLASLVPGEPTLVPYGRNALSVRSYAQPHLWRGGERFRFRDVKGSLWVCRLKDEDAR